MNTLSKRAATFLQAAEDYATGAVEYAYEAFLDVCCGGEADDEERYWLRQLRGWQALSLAVNNKTDLAALAAIKDTLRGPDTGAVRSTAETLMHSIWPWDLSPRMPRRKVSAPLRRCARRRPQGTLLCAPKLRPF